MSVRTCLLVVILMASMATVVAAAELAPCEDEQLGNRARCGSVRVLEDRSKPDGRTIDLNIVVLSGPENGAKAPVFALAGGPGQGATGLVGLGLGPWVSLLETRDMVFVDQRGTGASNLINCPVEAGADPQSVFDGLFDPVEVSRCLEVVSEHADVRLYDTERVVADLDEVREALGYERVALWGGSGGTRTAQVWLKRHPERIESVVIDGVTPTTFRSPIPFAFYSQRSLERVFEDCAAQPSCAEAFPALESDFARVLARFDQGPVETAVSRQDGTEVSVRMGRGEFGYAIRGVLYSARSIPELPKLLHHAAETGDVSEFAQRYWQRQVALRPVVSMGVHFSSICTEDMPFIEAQQITESTEGTFLGTYLVDQYGGACEEWLRGEVPDDYLEPVRSEVPVLLISGYYDPSTPSEFADEVAQFLPNSRHIVARNEAHGAEFGCARQTVLDFMASGSLDGLGTACEDAGPVEFVVD